MNNFPSEPLLGAFEQQDCRASTSETYGASELARDKANLVVTPSIRTSRSSNSSSNIDVVTVQAQVPLQPRKALLNMQTETHLMRRNSSGGGARRDKHARVRLRERLERSPIASITDHQNRKRSDGVYFKIAWTHLAGSTWARGDIVLELCLIPHVKAKLMEYRMELFQNWVI